MADISKITLPSNDEYNIKDATARQNIAGKQDAITVNGILQGDGSGNISAADTQEVTTLVIDSSPERDSDHLVTSGGVWTAIQNAGGGGGINLPPQSGHSGDFLTTDGNDTLSWADIPVTSVNGETGAVVLDASDVGALPDSTTIPQGTVTSVRVQASSPLQSSTSTEQSTSLNTTISFSSQNKNLVLAGPSSGSTAAAPTFRALVADDIPTITKSKISDFPTIDSTPTDGNTNNLVNSDGVYDKILDRTKIYTASCSTAAGTAAKVATLDDSSGFNLTAGTMVAVRFQYGNNATTPTLRVDSSITGTAKTIVFSTAYNSKSTGNGTTYNTWGPYETVTFTYDGTYWVNGGSALGIYNAYNKANSIVVPSAADAAPLMDSGSTGTVGTSTDYAREDHIHPTDTSRAPNNHASSDTTYGIGTGSNYGHVKLSDSTSSTSSTSNGIAATPAAVKAAYDLANNAVPKRVSSNPGTSVITHSWDGFSISITTAVDGNNSFAVNSNSTEIHNVVTPTANGDAVPKSYVDNAISNITVPTMDASPTDGNSSNTVSSNGVYDMVMGRTKIYTGSCSTAAATAAKVVTLDDATGFSLTTGTKVAVTFTYANTTTGTTTLNVNSTGAKNVVFYGDDEAGGYYTAGATYNKWGMKETLIFTYNGTSWCHTPSQYFTDYTYKLVTEKQDKIRVSTITTTTSWSGSGPYTQTVTLSNYTVTDNTKVDIQPNATNIAQLIADGTSALYILNNNSTLTLYAIGNHPTIAMTLQVTIEEVNTTS